MTAVQKNLTRPFVVCHMVASLDGRIDGDFFAAPEMRPVLEASNQIREMLDCKAVLYGATTMAETYAEGYLKDPPQPTEDVPAGDFTAPHQADRYYVVVDPQGTVRYTGGEIEKRGRPKAHVIVGVTEETDRAYLAYLRNLGVSYVFAGKDSVDCGLLLRKLMERFGIEKLMICGGGIVNWSFLQAGCIDELSLVICPLAEGSRDVATTFDRSAWMPGGSVVPFELKNVQTLPGNGLWLTYRPCIK